MAEAIEVLEGIQKLSSDLRKSAATLTLNEARYAVDTYYAVQKFRIEASNRISAIARGEDDEPHLFLDWMLAQMKGYENSIKGALGKFAAAQPQGDWLDSVKGIGPVIAAGLCAHIDIHKAPTVGHIWSFAGLNPTVEWKKGEKRPWNADLKTLCWKIGESFVKVSGKEDAFYGQLYKQRKALEVERNDRGDFADQAARKLEKFNIGKSTDAYKAYSSGKLPDAHVHARAKRWAVKLFLAHFHHVSYLTILHEQPPKPYIIAHGDHVHEVLPPNL